MSTGTKRDAIGICLPVEIGGKSEIAKGLRKNIHADRHFGEIYSYHEKIGTCSLKQATFGENYKLETCGGGFYI